MTPMAELSPDLTKIGAGLSRHCAGIEPAMPIRVLGTGFSSSVTGTTAGIALRLAGSLEALAASRRDAGLLPRLGKVLLLPIPDLEWQAANSDGFPFGTIGYRRMPGTTLPQRNLELTAQRSSPLRSGFFVCSTQSVSRTRKSSGIRYES